MVGSGLVHFMTILAQGSYVEVLLESNVIAICEDNGQSFIIIHTSSTMPTYNVFIEKAINLKNADLQLYLSSASITTVI